MRRLYFVWAAILCLVAPVAAHAGAHFVIGADLDYLYPHDPELYGERMASNSWGQDIAGISYSHGTARNQFPMWNSNNRLLSPGLTQALAYDCGLSLELSERWVWLLWSPNRDVDILYSRVMVPLTLMPTWTFNKSGKVRPFIGAGGGFWYVSTAISGADLYDQEKNPNFDMEGLPDAGSPGMANVPKPRRYLKDGRRFGRSGFFPAGQVMAGLEFGLTDALALRLDAKWSAVPIKTIDVVRVRDGNAESWHWEKQEITGDAGGLHGAVGVGYKF